MSPSDTPRSPPSPRLLLGFSKSIFLFSYSDIVPILGPSRSPWCFAGPTDFTAFACGFLWLELHLLTFEIKNQIVGLEEDRLSKPNRPIVSGRISIEAAQTLYLCVGALSVLYSVYHRVLLCSIVYMVAIYCYNEGGMSRNWFLKSFLGALGYVCYCWGTTIVFDHGKDLSRTTIIAVAVSGLVHTTTATRGTFVTDLGMRQSGEKTLAILLPPRFARWSLMVLIAAWTVGLVYLWKPPPSATLIFSLLGCISTVKFVLNHSVEADRESYWWYNMWLISAHLLPTFKRIADAAL